MPSGQCFGGAAQDISDIVRAPVAMCGQAVLGAAALVAQTYADVMLPIELLRPLSLFLLSVGSSGDRKSSVDEEAIRQVREHERSLAEAYAIKYPIWRNQHDTWKYAREDDP